MKKHIILLLAWALASAFTFVPSTRDAPTGEKVIVKIEKGDVSKTVEVRLANLEKMRTEVVVQSMDGTVWYSEYVRREAGFAAKLNLNAVPGGDYLLFVSNNAGMWSQAFTMSENDIAFFEKKSNAPDKKGVAVFASFSEGEKGKLIAHFTAEGGLSLGVQLANLQKLPASIRIVTMGDGVLFSKTVKGENGYAHSLNLEGVSSGNYFLYVHSADATVVQFFSITDEGSQQVLTLGDLQRLERPIEVPKPDERISGK